MPFHPKPLEVRQWRRKVAEISRDNRRLRKQIADLRKTQASILHAKLEWERTFDTVPDLIAIIDQDCRLKRINLSLARRLGLDFREALGQPCYKLICGLNEPPLYCPYLKSLIRGGDQVEGTEASILGGDFLLSFAPTVDQHGRISGGIHIFHDIKERKEYEQSIRENQERFRKIINSMPVMLHAHDDQGDLVFWNQECERVTGYSSEEMVGNPRATQILYPDPAENRRINDLLRHSKREFRNLEVELTSKAGRSKIVSWFNISERFPIKNWISWAVGIDITDKKQAEEETKRLEKRLQIKQNMESIGTLASGIAHEFNNYLSVIIGCLQLAAKDIPADHSCGPYLSLASKASNSAKDMVHKILSFSRQSRVNKSVLHLGPLLKESIKFLTASLPNDIDISSDIPDDSGLVLSDPSQMQQIVINLGTNAAHAMKEKGGHLSISLRQVEIGVNGGSNVIDLPPGPYHLVTFADDGTGMEPSVQERIFEPFFTTKKTGEGTGMGLAVVHGIVKSWGGEITVSSQVGHGTIFYIYFPLVAADKKK